MIPDNEIKELNKRFPSEVVAACVVRSGAVYHQKVQKREPTRSQKRHCRDIRELFELVFSDKRIPHVKAGRA